jgi:nucleoside-triphosphatase
VAIRVLVEGRPGSGKTTVVARLADLLTERGIDVRGFVTHEIREHGRRVGFDIETMDGDRATLAHVRIAGPPRVGKYGVDLEAFERIALPALAIVPRRGVVVIDELGKMELASDRFREAIARVVEAPVDLVATIHVFRDPYTDELKTRSDLERVRVTRTNRNELPGQLADRLSRARAAR